MRWYAAVAILCLTTTGAWARTYLTKTQALELAFPDADRVEAQSLFLTEEQVSRVEARSGATLDGRLFTLYVGERQGEAVGCAVIEAATVRTLPQTLLVVLGPDGAVRLVRVLAFFEPEEYRPPPRWLDQFRGRRLSPGLRLGGEIQGITGATLSAQAVARQVRKAAALCELLPGRRP